MSAQSLSLGHFDGAHHPWQQTWRVRRLGHAFDAADFAQDTFIRVLLGER